MLNGAPQIDAGENQIFRPSADLELLNLVNDGMEVQPLRGIVTASHNGHEPSLRQ